MGISWLDHVNIRTTNLAAMSRFYEDVLGMPAGPRPNFRFGGAWHYCGDRAAVHLVEVAKTPAGDETPRLEHFAFRSFGFAPFLDRLRRADISYDIAVVPGLAGVGEDGVGEGGDRHAAQEADGRGPGAQAREGE